MKPKEIQLESGKYYHIYNRGNNKERIFFNEHNYEYFMRKFDFYLTEYVDLFAFCLLPNHFHFIVRVKEAKEIPSSENPKIPSFQKMESLLSKQFRMFFISYSMAINKQQNRTGSLFQKNFKRIEIGSKEYLLNLVFYIHANPQLHGITNDFKSYNWSSYQ